MFTGLIEEVGVLRRLERRGDGGRLSIAATKVLEGTRIGDSISVSGACLTVVELGGQGFVVDCMPETLGQTTLGATTAGRRVNLERSLAMGGRLGGHLVLGHVDAVAAVLAVVRNDMAWRVRISLPDEVRNCVAGKGSIAIDGISLTVIRVYEESFEVGIIPHTMAQTTLGDIKPGTMVNVEADVLARYVLRTLQVLSEAEDKGPQAPGKSSQGGLTEALLRDQGFI
ncbi:MAG TPA: riboflavin synthase [Thermoleophilia bacterium]|nr:riboflavin synthase [Thermoleophilia bacterium]